MLGGAIDCRVSSFSKRTAAVAVVGYFELTSTKWPAFSLLYTTRIVTVVVNIKKEARVGQKNGVDSMLSRHADSGVPRQSTV